MDVTADLHSTSFHKGKPLGVHISIYRSMIMEDAINSFCKYFEGKKKKVKNFFAVDLGGVFVCFLCFVICSFCLISKD